jgi:hypothetical protein
VQINHHVQSPALSLDEGLRESGITLLCLDASCQVLTRSWCLYGAWGGRGEVLCPRCGGLGVKGNDLILFNAAILWGRQFRSHITHYERVES